MESGQKNIAELEYDRTREDDQKKSDREVWTVRKLMAKARNAVGEVHSAL